MSFIFQSKPLRYDLREVLKPDRTVAWVASRYRDRMKPGEIVYLWLAGEPQVRGIYGWGEITGQEPFLDSSGIYRVELTYRRNFLDHPSQKHLSVKEIESVEALASLLILRLPMGTNFMLEKEEDEALRALIRKKYDPEWVPPAKKKEASADE